MSHEMLTPLNSIINLSVFIDQKLKRRFDMDEELSGGMGSSTDNNDIWQSLQYLHIIRSSANILQYLVKDLIDLMNIKQDKFTKVNQEFSPSQACEEIISCFEL